MKPGKPSFVLALVCCLLAVAVEPSAAELRRPPDDERLVATYSVVGRDLDAGLVGVAVQSHWFGVGSRVAHARAGVGAIATQAMTNVVYGSRGLELLAAGSNPAQVIESLTARDPLSNARQVIMIGATTGIAAHTGDMCIPFAGHVVGEDFAVAANLMATDRVVPAMAEAYRRTEGPLHERLLRALEAAEDAGGDLRGRQSAGLVMVSIEATGNAWTDRPIDVRVDDHPEPLVELRRLVSLARAYDSFGGVGAALAQGDPEEAIAVLHRVRALAPDRDEFLFWSALDLARHGQLDEAVVLFNDLLSGEGDEWRELLRRLPGTSGLPLEKEQAETLVHTILELLPQRTSR